MALSGVDGIRVLGQIRHQDEYLRSQFLFRNRVLNEIRSNLYLSGTYVRDYLLDPDSERAAAFGANLTDVRRQMQSALASYKDRMDPAQAPPYEKLQAELAAYWAILDPVLRWDAATRRERGYPFLRDEVFPRRTAMLNLASEIDNINEQQLAGGNDQVVDLLVRFQTRLYWTLLATLASGLGMAAFSTHRILKLEAHSEMRLEEMQEARRQLANLSARLVQAQEGERRSLSRELHDEVGQSLSAVLVELRNLSAILGKGANQAVGQVEIIKTLVENTVRTVRNMALLLRPSMLDDLGLVPALRWQAREVSKRTGMDVNVVTEIASEDLPDEHKTCIYRVVQEALHNCSRHSHAHKVQIEVRQLPNSLRLRIEDDGQGFDVSQSKGMGLLGMEERAASLGGTCSVQSAPQRGTILTLDLPFKGEAILGREQREANTHSAS